jgi:hypothetical protein
MSLSDWHRRQKNSRCHFPASTENLKNGVSDESTAGKVGPRPGPSGPTGTPFNLKTVLLPFNLTRKLEQVSLLPLPLQLEVAIDLPSPRELSSMTNLKLTGRLRLRHCQWRPLTPSRTRNGRGPGAGAAGRRSGPGLGPGARNPTGTRSSPPGPCGAPASGSEPGPARPTGTEVTVPTLQRSTRVVRK